MNADLIFEILNLGLSVLQANAPGKVQDDAAIAQTITLIVQKGVQAVEDHTGQPMDTSLIKPEAPIA
jgi:hypothetical protein